jgi:hypothetical protein
MKLGVKIDYRGYKRSEFWKILGFSTFWECLLKSPELKN